MLFKSHSSHPSLFRWSVIIVGLAVLLRVGYFFLNFEAHNRQIVPTIKGDDGYYELTENLVAGRGFVNDPAPLPPVTPNPLRPPLWPLMAALCKWIGGNWLIALCLLLMGSSIPLLGMRLVPLLTHHIGLRGEADVRRLTIWVGFLLACEPYSILLSTIMYTETSFTFLFLIGLYFLFSYLLNATWRRIVWAAVFLGLACLIKPTIQYAWFLIPAFIVGREMLMLYTKGERWQRVGRRTIAHAGVFAVLFLLILTPWLIRNQKEFGVIGMSAQPAYNLYIYLVPTVRAFAQHTDFKTEYDAFIIKTGFDENMITLATSKHYSAEALAILRHYPGALLKNAVVSTVTFFTHDGMLTVLQYAGVYLPKVIQKPVLALLFSQPLALLSLLMHVAFSPLGIVMVMRLFWYGVTLGLVLGFISVYRSSADWKKALSSSQGFAFLMMLYFVLTTMINGLGVNARFRVPLLTILFTFSCFGLYRLYQWGILYLRRSPR